MRAVLLSCALLFVFQFLFAFYLRCNTISGPPLFLRRVNYRVPCIRQPSDVIVTTAHGDTLLRTVRARRAAAATRLGIPFSGPLTTNHYAWNFRVVIAVELLFSRRIQPINYLFFLVWERPYENIILSHMPS